MTRPTMTRSTFIAIGIAAVIVGVSIWALVRDRGATAPSPVQPGSFERFDLRAVPRSVTVANGAVWVAFADHSVHKLDPRDGSVLAKGRVPFIPGQILGAHGSVWVGAIEGNVIARIDPEDADIVDQIEIGTTPQSLAAGGSEIYVSAFDEGVVRPIDPEGGGVEAPVFESDEAFPSGIAVAFDSLWITDVVRDSVTRVSLDGREPVDVGVGDSPTEVIPAYGSMWIANFNERTVTPIDPATNEAGASIAVGAKPGALAGAAGFVWVLRPGSDSLVVIDPEAGRWTGDVYEVGDTPQDIAVGLGYVWVVNQDMTMTRVPV